MYTQIIAYLLQIIKFQHQLILFLVHLLKYYMDHPLKPQLDAPDKIDHQKFKVDELPIIKTHELKDYRELIDQHFQETGKVLKPIQRRKNSTKVDPHIKCPSCQAPHNYLYMNNGDKGQFQCKVCSMRFNQKNRFLKDFSLFCPHCEKPIDKIKRRTDFTIYKCRNNDCSYYQNRLKNLSEEDCQRFEAHPHEFKMRYIYRDFDLTLSEVESSPKIPTIVDLSRIHSSPKVLGTILTYHVNYGMSAEKTAALMYDIHRIKISGQTIRNYARSVGALVQPFTTNFPYELSNQICGDETYIRVQGKWHYIFFFFDAVNKIILSKHVSAKRDTKAAIRAIHDVLRHYSPEDIEKLTLIVDGNPIYLLARIFYAKYHVHFDITQVIGLTNEDEVSAEYRPLKQIIERLNRTFKGNYKPLGGYGAQAGSIAHVELFATYFNFLRPHSALEGHQVPVQLPELERCSDMPQKWIKLIQLSQEYIVQQQALERA